MRKLLISHLFSLSPFLALTLFLLLAVAPVRAQEGTLQVNILGIPPVLSSPFVADQVQRYEQGRYPIQVIYSSPTAQPASVRFRFQLDRDGLPLVEATSEPVELTPGIHLYRTLDDEPPIVFRDALADLFGQLDAATRRQVAEGGVFPEGLYTLTLEALPESPLITSLPGTALFTVRYAQPPVLFTPSDEAQVIMPQPTFSWTPVTAPPGSLIEYDLLIVEMLPGQTPLQAVESNRAHVEVTLPQQTTFVYTPDLLPLDPGTAYAWQVTAHDANESVAFTEDGQSEIYTFTRGTPGGFAADPLALASVDLEPGFGSLTALADLEITEDAFAYTLNGFATLELLFDGQSMALTAEVIDLELQKDNLTPPVVLGGTVRAGATGVPLPAGDLAAMLELGEVTWTFGQGFEATGHIALPDGQNIAAEGTLQLTGGAVFGTLEATGEPLVSIEQDPIGVDVTRLAATFPEARLEGAGRVRLFGEPTACAVDPLVLTLETLLAGFDCDVQQAFNLADADVEQEVVLLMLDRIEGQAQLDWATEALAYDATLTGGIDVNVMTGPRCGADVVLGLADDGVQLHQFVPTCQGLPTVDLGLARMALSNFRLPHLGYTPGDGWDFALDLDVDLAFRFDPPSSGDENASNGDSGGFDSGEVAPGLRLPTISGLRISPDGIRLPDVQFDRIALGMVPPFHLASFEIQPTGFRMPPLDLDPGAWRGGSGGADDGATGDDGAESPPAGDFPGDWDFDFDFDLRFNPPSFDGFEGNGEDEALVDDVGDSEADDSEAGNHEDEGAPGFPFELPDCLRNATISVTNAQFEGGLLSAELPATLIPAPGCTIPLGEDTGYAVTLRELGGSLDGSVGLDGFTLDGGVTALGDLAAGDPFRCDGAVSTLATTELSLRSDGLFEGIITDFAPACPLAVGPFEATIPDGTLTFAVGPDGQQARLDATGQLAYPAADGQTLTATGAVGIDLIAGDVDELSFVLAGPFTWHLPEDAPVLAFTLDRAEIDETGVLVVGEQALEAGTETLAVQFDSVRIGLDRPGVRSGQIVFDDPFALNLAIDPVTQEPTFGVVPAGDSLTADPGVRIDLAGLIRIDSLGLTASGRADAQIAFAEHYLSGLAAAYSDNFAIRFDPFGVAVGQVDFLFEEHRIAYLDEAGFHPDPTFFEVLIPDRLPLPAEEIAYVQLKREGELLVDYTTDENGALRLSTKPGEVLDFVVPALQQPGQPVPALQVTFSDVVVDPFGFRVTAGEIRAAVPPGDPAFDLAALGVPLGLEEIVYANREVEGVPVTALFFDGTLQLFDTNLPSDNPVSLFVQSDGRVQGRLALPSLDADVPLVPGEALVTLHLASVTGEVDLPLAAPELGTFTFDLDGALRVNVEGAVAAQTGVQATFTESGFTLDQVEPEDGTEVALDLGAFAFRVDRIASLFLSYDRAAGWDFYAGLDVTLGVQSDAWTFLVPLQGVEVRPDGFHLPEQEVHEGTDPALVATPFELDSLRLRPLAARMPEVVVTWADLQSVNLLGFLPRFDFELTLPAFGDVAPDLASATLTLSDVGFTDGILTGSLEPYAFPDDGARFFLGPPASEPPVLFLETAAGGFTRLETADGPQQGFDLNVAGHLGDLDYFVPDEACAPVPFDLRLSSTGGITGSIQGVSSCGAMPLGPVTLAVDDAGIDFTFSEGTQEATLTGTARVTLPPPADGATPVEAQGTLALDLVTGALLDGFVEITEPFGWALPNPATPLFDLTVDQARLDPSGLTLAGAGTVHVEENIDVTLSLDELRLDVFDQFRIVDGSATLASTVALEVGLSPLAWQAVDPESEHLADHSLRLTTPGSLTVTPDGISLSGTSTASLRFGALEEVQDFPDLALEFLDGFRLGFDYSGGVPVFIEVGQADFLADGERIAYFDAAGFHFELDELANAAADALLPARLGLPDTSVAYLQLKDEAGNLLANLERDDAAGLWSLATGDVPIDLVLAGLGDDAPRVGVTFEVGLDDAFNISVGSIDVTFNDQPLDLEPYLGIPLELTRLFYEPGSPFQLGGGGRIRLPEALGGVAVALEDLRFGAGGIEQVTVVVGGYSEAFDAAAETITSQTVGDILTFNLMGARLAVGEETSMKLSGTLESPMLADDTDEPAHIFYHAQYEPGNLLNGQFSVGHWTFEADVPGDELPLGPAIFRPLDIDAATPPFRIELTDEAFLIALSGVLSVPEMMGDESNFAVTVRDLQLGTNGISIGEAQADIQQFELFDGMLIASLTDLRPTLTGPATAPVLLLSMDGAFTFMGKSDLTFDDLQVGTDGTFARGGGSIDLVADGEPIPIIEDVFQLDAFGLALDAEQRLSLTAGGTVFLPDPIDASASLAITVGANMPGSADDLQDIGSLVYQAVIDGPHFQFEDPEDGYQIGNGGAEFAIGTFATIDLVSAGIGFDLLDQQNPITRVYGNAAVYLENEEEKLLMFGDPGDLIGNPGLGWSRDEGWEFNFYATPGASPVAFDAAFFNVEINSVSVFDPDGAAGPAVFGVRIGGMAGMSIEGIEGSTAFDGFELVATPETAGIANWGLLKPPISFSIMDVVTLELTDFELIVDDAGTEVTLTENSASGGEPGDNAERTITVTKYLSFGGNLTLMAGFSGGVEQVLFYEEVLENDARRFSLYVKDANITLGDVSEQLFSLRMFLKYEMSATGFELFVAGAGSLAEVGELVAAGKIGMDLAKLEDDPFEAFSFGIFVLVRASSGIPLIPQVPVTLLLTGGGGGFFLNPTQEEISIIKDLAGFQNAQTNGLPPGADLDLALLLYGQLGIVGQGGVYVMEGQGLITVTDLNVSVDAEVTVVKQSGRIEGWVSLNFVYPYVNDSGGITFALTGMTGLDVTYDPAFTSKPVLGVQVVVTAASLNDIQVDWKVEGELRETELLGIPADGTFILSPAGFYAELSINANYSLFVVTLDGNFLAKVWAVPEGDFLAGDFDFELGAFAQIDVSADVLGARVQGLAEGTFVKDPDNNTSLYALASLSVEVGGVFSLVEMATGTDVTGSMEVYAFAEFENGALVNAGVLNEIDGVFADLIAQAQEQAGQMEEEANAARDAVNDAVPAFQLDDAVIAEAGLRLQRLNDVFGVYAFLAQSVFLVPVYQAEALLYTAGSTNSIPAAFRWVGETIFTDSDRPDASALDEAESEMGARVAAVESASPGVEQRLQGVTARAIAWEAEAVTTVDGLTAPVTDQPAPVTSQSGGLRVTATVPFSVDPAAAQAQSAQLGQLQGSGSFAEQDTRYRMAIADVMANLHTLEELMADASAGPSLHALAEQYTDAYEAVGAYFSAQASHFWELHAHTQARLDQLREQEAAIDAAIETSINKYKSLSESSCENRAETVASDSAWPGYEDCRTLGVYIAKKRIESLMALAGESNSAIGGALSTLESEMEAYQANGNQSAFDDRFRTTGRQFWFEMHEAGLSAYHDEARTLAQATAAEYNQHRSDLIAAHRNYTASLDALYQVKARLTAALYGLIDAYLAWYDHRPEETRQQAVKPDPLEVATRGSNGDLRGTNGRSATPARLPAVAALRQKRETLAQALEPPTITALQVRAQRLGRLQASSGGGFLLMTTRYRYLNRADVTWTATHPLGLVESGFAIRSGTASSLAGFGAFQSVGERTDLTHWAFKGDEYTGQGLVIAYPIGVEPPPKSFSVAIRARGPAGYTISRFGTFEAEVDGQATGPAMVSTLYDDILADDPTPPPAPLVTASGLRESAGTLWSSDPITLALMLQASDGQSGIQAFEVALGTSPGGTDVQDWAEVVGIRTVQGSLVTLRPVLRDLALEPGTAYHVSARVRNGAGAVSSVRTLGPLIVDQTPPDLPAAPVAAGGVLRLRISPAISPRVAPLRSVPPTVWSVPPTVYPATTGVPSWLSPRTAAGPRVAADQQRVTWSAATDAESGIARYGVLVTDAPSVHGAAFTEDTAMFTTQLEADVSATYTDTAYVHLRAYNHAGMGSQIRTVPIRLPDPSKPEAPVVRARMRADGVRTYLPQLAADGESGVAGYQFAAGTAPGQTNLRPWPSEGIDVILPEDAASQAVPSSFFLTKAQLGNPASGLDIYVHVRAVNGQGLVSDAVASGPVVLDATPPVAPSMTLTHSGTVLTMAVEGLQDAESGLVRAVAMVMDALTDAVLASRLVYALPAGSAPSQQAFSRTRSVTVPGLSQRAGVNVALVVENGAGLTATTTTSLVIDPAALEHIDAPTGVEAIAQAQRVEVTWNAVASPYLAGYRIERAPAGSEVFQAIREAEGLGFTDAGGEAGMRYRIRAVNVKGVIGTPSTEVVAQIAAAPVAAVLPPPTELIRIVTAKDVALSWRPVKASNVAGYRVHRANQKGQFVPIHDGVVAGTSYQDKSGTGASTYYVVTVGRDGTESAPSTVVPTPDSQVVLVR